MKKLSFFVCSFLACTFSFAQNVGIGTTTPTLSKLQIINPSGTQLLTAVSDNGVGISHSVATSSPTLGFNSLISGGYKFMGAGYGSIFQYNPSVGNLGYFASSTLGTAGQVISSFNAASLLIDSNGYTRFPQYSSFGSAIPHPDSGRVLISHNSTTASPHLQIHETSTTDFSRMEFTNAASSRYWHLAGFTSSSGASLDRFNLYHSGVGDIISLTGSGNVGIGTTSPATKLHLSSTSSEVLRVQGSNPYISLYDNTDGYRAFWWYNGTDVSFGTSGAAALKFTTNSNIRAQITADGRMVIGSSTSLPATGYLLSVDGKIISEEIKVQLSTAWPDYVFEKQYHLKSLPDLENYIAVNKHLPGIPAAEEMEKEGIMLGNMQTRMMEKIEELTLYIIDLNKKHEKISSELEELKKAIKK